MNAAAAHLRLRAWFWPVIGGLAQALSIAAPWDGQPRWWLQCLSLALLVLLLEQDRDAPRAWRRAALQGWLFATAWLCGSFWWLYVSMHVYGGLAAPLAALATLALPAALALYYAVACGAYVLLAPRRCAWRIVLFTALWTLAELLRGSWFTGFPWAAGGYAHLDGPLVMFARLAGVYGVGAVAAMVAAGFVLGLRPLKSSHAPARWRWTAWLAPAALGAFLVYGGIESHCLVRSCAAPAARDPASTGRLGLALLQGNIPQDQKFMPSGGIETALRWYGEQLDAARAPLVVTPEIALPLLPSRLPAGYLAAIETRYARGDQAAIVGLPLRASDGNYTNSVLGFAPGRSGLYRYDKHHLVPFGEFVPPLFRWFVDRMEIPLGDFRRGALAQSPFVWQGQRIAPNICYEDLFGDEIGANFRSEVSAPTVLLNVSNIAWFGDTVAIDQHLGISRMRALEFERPMVRATNTGATAVIDHRGRVTHQLPRLTRGVLVAEVEGRSGLTPYARWVSRFGLAPLWIAALAIVALAAIARLRH